MQLQIYILSFAQKKILTQLLLIGAYNNQFRRRSVTGNLESKMDNKKVAEIIGCHERTVRRMSPRKRQQWQALAAKCRTMAWFDILSQLMFEVDSYNATTGDCGIAINLCKSMLTLHKFDGWFQIEQSFYVHDINQLTEALQYVQGLNGGVK